MSTVLFVATRNTQKRVELQRILDAALAGGRPAPSDAAGGTITLVDMGQVEPYEEAPETGLTFADNALLKAREGVTYTGLPTVADDSGLAVDALNGMPGVFSARWAGSDCADPASRDCANLRLLLAQISDVDDAHRGAAFVCAAALVLPGGAEFTVEGRMSGRLLREPRGTGGFGYDPIFVCDGQTRTNAELTPVEKDAISHRGTALRALAEVIAVHLRP